jgi:hypothetical protein
MVGLLHIHRVTGSTIDETRPGLALTHTVSAGASQDVDNSLHDVVRCDV